MGEKSKKHTRVISKDVKECKVEKAPSLITGKKKYRLIVE
jgi:hypothetical protein